MGLCRFNIYLLLFAKRPLCADIINFSVCCCCWHWTSQLDRSLYNTPLSVDSIQKETFRWKWKGQLLLNSQSVVVVVGWWRETILWSRNGLDTLADELTQQRSDGEEAKTGLSFPPSLSLPVEWIIRKGNGAYLLPNSIVVIVQLNLLASREDE